MSFKYLFIPADSAVDIVQHEGSKSGGLENDRLRRHAEMLFSSTGIDKDKQKEAITAQLSSKGVDPAKIEEMLNSHIGDRVAGSVEIISLCIPTSSNNFHSVSLYCDGNSAFKENGKVPNIRATSIVRACGHVNTVVMGDCFIGRAKDDEREEWERLDFLEEEFSLAAPWVAAASVANAGKNLSNYSTSGALDNWQNQMNAQQNNNNKTKAKKEVTPAEIVSEFSDTQAYVWTQSSDEVEVRMKLPAGLLSKHLLVKITPASVQITRKAGGAVEGLDAAFAEGAKLGGAVKADDSTWSIADEREGRLLTLTLAKAKNNTWKHLIA